MSLENIFEVALAVTSGLGPRQARGLLRTFVDAESIFQSGSKNLLRIPGLGPSKVNKLLHADTLRAAEMVVKTCKKEDVQIIGISLQEYPNRLRECEDSPLVLFKKGPCSLNSPRALAVVGTRSATAHGQRTTEQFIAQLAEKMQVLIVSGLAYGIDSAAHRQAVKVGLPTVGILAHGLDKIYPSDHHRLAMRMIENGGLVSEFPPFTKLVKENFPRRNRIIAGLADAVLVVEASKSGGALITAELALGYNRDVYAVPGRINDAFSEGCLELIRQNKAALVTKSTDLIQAMNWDQDSNSHQQLTITFSRPLNEVEAKIKLLVNSGSNFIDSLAGALELNNSALAATLLQLELEGLIKSLPGARIKWVGPTE